jgi:hypothetical protein
VANRTIVWLVVSIHAVRVAEHASAMAASPRFPRPASYQAAAVQSLLATERDAHRRQRELVRASLVMCPGKGAMRGARRAA